MSLLRQLLISVTVAIFIILAGAVWLSTHSAREYLNTQLQIQTDSAATSLALTLSQPANQDEITRELLIAALFDTGQFSLIEFKDSTGEVLVQRLGTRMDGAQVPSWFVQYASVDSVQAAAQVSDGWRQVGQVLLEADPGYARQSLWGSFLRLVGWVVAAGVLWGVFVFFLIRWLRRMLHEEVTKQLNLIVAEDAAPFKGQSDSVPTQTGALTNESPALVHSPKKRAMFSELKEVTRAIASARESILATAEERYAQIESLELELNQDPITQLANRKYFINELRTVLDKGHTGWVLIFRLRDLAEINRLLARPLVDDWLLNMSQQLQAVVQQVLDGEHFMLARLNGSDFVLLLDEVADEVLQTVTATVRDELMRQRIQLASGQFCRWALAKTDYHSDEAFSHVLARLDQALMRAESAGHRQFEVVARSGAEQPPQHLTDGESQWRVRLHHALEQHLFILAINQRELQGEVWNEATLMLQDEGTNKSALSAYQFIPVATRLGLSGACDLQAIKLALQWLDENQGHLVMRISLPSLSQPAFTETLPQLLAARAAKQPQPHLNQQALQQEGRLDAEQRLYIELDAFALDSALPAVQQFAANVRPFGMHLGVRRILSMPQVVLEFESLQMSYARVSPEMLEQIINKPGGRCLIEALWRVCQQAHTPWIIEGALDELSAPLYQWLIQAEVLTAPADRSK